MVNVMEAMENVLAQATGLLKIAILLNAKTIALVRHATMGQAVQTVLKIGLVSGASKSTAKYVIALEMENATVQINQEILEFAFVKKVLKENFARIKFAQTTAQDMESATKQQAYALAPLAGTTNGEY